MSSNKIQDQLLCIFHSLLDHFGPRHWWPAETPLEVVFGCILTQNVTWKNVEQAISNLKEKDLINIDRILAVQDCSLADLIKTTRYYNQKASSLKNFCRFVKTKFNGNLDELFELNTEDLRTILLSLKGIGRETADSIILYAANKPIFVVDAYTKRIFLRLGIWDYDMSYDEVQKLFVSNLPSDTYLFNEYHALIDRLGHYICKSKTPCCSQCPVSQFCRTQSSC